MKSHINCVDLEVWSKFDKRACIKRIAWKYARDFDSDWQRVDAFSHCVTLKRVLLPQIISYSDTKLPVLVVMECKRARVIHVYELTFLLHTSRSTKCRHGVSVSESFLCPFSNHYVPTGDPWPIPLDGVTCHSLITNIMYEKSTKLFEFLPWYRQLKDATKRHTTMKRDQQLQRKMNAQLMEEARRREGELSTDTQSLQVSIDNLCLQLSKIMLNCIQILFQPLLKVISRGSMLFFNN